jgi:hypothetical protein
MNPTLPLARTRTGERLYVESDPRNAIVAAICAPLELTPNRRLLVVGCTGSGKTTLIRRCVQRIRGAVKETGDSASYVDVSKSHRLDTEKLEGVLVAIAGERLSRAPIKSKTVDDEALVNSAKEAVEAHARGYDEWVEPTNASLDDDSSDESDHEEYADGYFAHRPGVLRAPVEPLQPKRFLSLVDPLKTLRKHVVGEGTTIFAFDSLDRLSDPGRFSDAVKHDLPVLAAAGIGTIVVGPVRYSLGSDRSIRDLFDAVHVVPTVDTRTSEGRAFLARVLDVRDEGRVLSNSVVPKLIDASGGVLRDLVSLAQRAGEEAYSKGHDPVEVSDADVAISVLGDSLAFGIDDANLKVLRSLDETGEFVIRGESELALVDQRRVLNVGTGAWRIHPALLPKLRGIPKVRAS